jgi:5-methylcytosine-specific restriction endonuclease McrA
MTSNKPQAVWCRNKYQTDPEYREKILARQSEWSKNNRDKKNKQSRALRAKKKQQAIDYLGGKCVGCGTTHNLQFDHIDRSLKEFNITKRIDLGFEKIKPELDKCRLLCKSCHNIKTRTNNDNAETLKGYTLSSVQHVDDQIIIIYKQDVY